MSFTIGQTFDLLFGGSAADDYSNRRWFRRPSAFDGTNSSTDAQDAEAVLVGRLRGEIGEWEKTNALSRNHSMDPARHLPPRMPYDVFAIAAYLVEGAGIYHHLQPQKAGVDGKTYSGSPDIRHIDITQADRDAVLKAAAAWVNVSADGETKLAQKLTTVCWNDILPLFESWWVVFAACAECHVLERPEEADGLVVPKWWKHAWRLMAIADEAAANTAYQFDMTEMRKFADGDKTSIRWFEFEVLLELANRSYEAAAEAGDKMARRELDISTLSVATRAVASVLPKVRTPSVGCTLRSLSHHLALLPPMGIVKGRWTPNYLRPNASKNSMPTSVMNLVLVPLPYSLSARSFEPALVEDVSGGSPSEVPKFGYFDVKQDWLGADLVDFLDDIITTAKVQSPTIHGFIFPELALDFDTYQLLRDHIQSKLPEAEILISGISSDRDGKKGNFVAATTLPGHSGNAATDARETIREKHHRWKLDRSQLRAYGLLGALSPEISWWENIALQSRQIDFSVIRRDSVMAAMICEDLARVDPCQQVIRAVGPNLVVALLMDAPQVPSRWPARYATVLSEDPGCAVLTLTSRGLMTLQHRTGTHRSSGDDRVVAMWRDDAASAPIQLTCPYDSQAVLLTILEEPVEDIALDGRRDNAAKAWRYVGSVPLRLPNARSHAKVLGEEDLSCWR